MDYENPAGEPRIITPEDATKEAEYEKGKKIQLPDGSIETVYSVNEEIAARKKYHEEK